MKLKVLVTALALFAGTAVANAADDAWFSLIGGDGVQVSGGPGQTLVIDKPAGPGVFTLIIGYNFTNVGQYGSPQGMAGWGFNLGAAANTTYGAEDFANSLGGGYDVSLANANGAILNVGGASSAANGLDGLVFAFSITIDKSAGPAGKTEIFGDLETQVPNSPFAWYGSFGPNTGRYGIPNYNDRTGELPVISINNVPEPATIALLGMGVVALIRRRR